MTKKPAKPSLVTDAQRFYRKLAKNNNREWFLEHKAEFEETIKQPALLFADIVNGELEELTGRTHKPKIFRPNRDVRFSRDKTPYKTHLHMIWKPEKAGDQAPAWFLGIAPKYVKAGGGRWGFDKDVQHRYREKVAAKRGGADLKAIMTKLTQAGFSIDDPELKRIPPPYDKEHANGDLLRRKSLSAWSDVDAKRAGANLLKAATTEFRKLQPLHEWLLKLV